MRDWRTGLFLFALWPFAEPATAQERADMNLVDAGFVMREANTPEKMARLKAIPPRKILARSKNGERYYVYADPDYCRCALVGTAQALQTYRDLPRRLPKVDNVPPTGFSPEQIVIDDMQDDAPMPSEMDILDLHFR